MLQRPPVDDSRKSRIVPQLVNSKTFLESRFMLTLTLTLHAEIHADMVQSCHRSNRSIETLKSKSNVVKESKQ